jgi:hypothetical protein
VHAGVHHEPADVQRAVLEPGPGHRSRQAGLVVEAEERLPAVAQFLQRLVQSRDAVESDQFGLYRIGSALEIPQTLKGVRVGKIESPGFGATRTYRAATVPRTPGQPDVSGLPPTRTRAARRGALTARLRACADPAA